MKCECCGVETEDYHYSPFADKSWGFKKLCASCYVDLEEK